MGRGSQKVAAEAILYGRLPAGKKARNGLAADDFNPFAETAYVTNSYFFEAHNGLWSGSDYWVARAHVLPSDWKMAAGDEVSRRYINYAFSAEIRGFLNSTASSYRQGDKSGSWVPIRFEIAHGQPELFRVECDRRFAKQEDINAIVLPSHLDSVEELTDAGGQWLYSPPLKSAYYLSNDQALLQGMVRCFPTESV